MLDKIQVSSQTSNLLMLIRNELEHIVNKAEKYLHDKEQLLKEHKNFAVVLEKVSETKQLIMTFTPDEYSENIKKVFEPIAATSARLKMNSYNEITTII